MSLAEKMPLLVCFPVRSELFLCSQEDFFVTEMLQTQSFVQGFLVCFFSWF